MKVKMQARQLWDAIEYGDLPYHDDRRRWVRCSRTRSRPRRRGTPSPQRASTAFATPRCSDCARSGRTSPSVPVSKSRISPFAVKYPAVKSWLHRCEEVTGRLKTVDDLEEETLTEPISVGGKLMYTEEQWLARQKEKKKGGDGSGSSSSSKEHH
jgi:hypothetical protein